VCGIHRGPIFEINRIAKIAHVGYNSANFITVYETFFPILTLTLFIDSLTGTNLSATGWSFTSIAKSMEKIS
jgi:hypothetical protein